jgi:hypothetical protein
VLIMSQISPVHATPSHPISLRSILLLSSHTYTHMHTHKTCEIMVLYIWISVSLDRRQTYWT